MQYKGDDLDLRVPHARAPRESYVPDYEPPVGNGRWSRPQHVAPGGGEPLWVDEVLLACCNYAFDVAQANGAAEVGLEHLVNALTRVDAAARALEARGVREGQLRRDSAALIASEIPAPNAGEAVAPRRSPELEDVLRRAAEMANRRGAAAGVEDALWVLLHYNRDLPVLQLLRRMSPDWQRSDWSRAREFVAPEPAAPSRPVQLVASDGMQARMAGMEDSLRLMQVEFANERKALMDLVRDIQRDVVAQRGDGAAFRGDLGQRLETLERSVQVRPDTSRIAVQIAERMTGLEKSIHSGLTDAARGTTQLGQRLAALEVAVSDGRGAAGQQAIADRMATLEKAVHGGLGEGARNWSHLGQRLAALESALGDRRDGGQSEALTERLADRMTAIERSIETAQADGQRSASQLVQRLSAIERSIGDGSKLPVPDAITNRLTQIERRLESATEDSQLHWTGLTERIGEFGRQLQAGRTEHLQAIESRLAASPAETGTATREFAERLAGLERAVRSGFGDAAQTTGQIAERLLVVERGFAERPRDDGEALLILDDRLGAIERMLDTRGQQVESATAQIVERLHILEERPGSQGALDAATFISPLTTRLESLEGNSVGRAEALHTSLGDINVRLAALEERMRAEAAVTEEALRGRDQDFDFIYSEIKQLGQSQATLNSAVNDWRNESQTHFGTLAGRLDTLLIAPPVMAAGATAAAASLQSAPFELPAVVKTRTGPTGAATASVDRPEPLSGEGVKADDYVLPSQPERGFWFWLFGTSSVLRANRENDLKIDRMRQNIRDARERRRTQA